MCIGLQKLLKEKQRSRHQNDSARVLQSKIRQHVKGVYIGEYRQECTVTLHNFSYWKSHHNANPVNTTKCPFEDSQTRGTFKMVSEICERDSQEVGEVYPPKNDLPDVGTLQRYILTAITNGCSYKQ